MRIERIGEFVAPFIGVWIGPFRRTQQRKPQNVALGIVAILAIVKQAHSVRSVGEIRPLQRWHFEFPLFCRRVACRWPLDGAVGDFKSGFVIVRARRHGHFQQDVFFAPVRSHVHIHARRACRQGNVPNERRVLKMILYPQYRAQRAAFHELDFIGVV